MKKIVFTFFVLTMFLASCKNIEVPVVKTVSYEIVTLKSVLLTGEVTNESGGAVTKRGFYWGTNPTPSLTDNSSENGYGPGVFTESVSLIYGQEYFFRSYAVDANGTQFGNILSIKVEIKPVTGTMTDSRDGKTYATVKINNQTWMARNLAYLPAVSPSSNGSESSPYYYVYNYEGSNVAAAKAVANYDTYGVLYNWEAAKISCPSGWHLPTDAEWTILTDYLASSGGFMKEAGTTHWNSPNTDATNASGFTALPGGHRYYDGDFLSLGLGAFFWSSSENGSDAWGRGLYYDGDGVYRHYYYRGSGFSVRCLQN